MLCLFDERLLLLIGLSVDKAKKMGFKADGTSPMPREMSFPVSKTQTWHDLYDFIR